MSPQPNKFSNPYVEPFQSGAYRHQSHTGQLVEFTASEQLDSPPTIRDREKELWNNVFKAEFKLGILLETTSSAALISMPNFMAAFLLEVHLFGDQFLK